MVQHDGPTLGYRQLLQRPDERQAGDVLLVDASRRRTRGPVGGVPAGLDAIG